MHKPTCIGFLRIQNHPGARLAIRVRCLITFRLSVIPVALLRNECWNEPVIREAKIRGLERTTIIPSIDCVSANAVAKPVIDVDDIAAEPIPRLIANRQRRCRRNTSLSSRTSAVRFLSLGV